MNHVVAQLHVLHVPGTSDARDANTAVLADAGACIHSQDVTMPVGAASLMASWRGVLGCAAATATRGP